MRDEELDDDDPTLVDDEPDEDLMWEEGDPADRRKDPLRKPEA